MANPSKHKLTLQLSSVGHGKVLLDGEELPMVTDVEIKSSVGQPSLVTIKMIALELDTDLEIDDSDLSVEKVSRDE